MTEAPNFKGSRSDIEDYRGLFVDTNDERKNVYYIIYVVYIRRYGLFYFIREDASLSKSFLERQRFLSTVYLMGGLLKR